MEFGASIFLSGLIGFLVGGYFYWKSSKDLRDEAKKLRDMVNVLGRGLESSGVANFNRDEHGNIKSVQFILEGKPGRIEISGPTAELSHIKKET